MFPVGLGNSLRLTLQVLLLLPGWVPGRVAIGSVLELQ